MKKICPIMGQECMKTDCGMWEKENGMCAVAVFPAALKRESAKLAAVRAEKKKQEEKHGE